MSSAGTVAMNQEIFVDSPNCPLTTSEKANPLDQKEVNIASNTRSEHRIFTIGIPMLWARPMVAISVTVSEPSMTATVNAAVISALRERPLMIALPVCSFFSIWLQT